MHTVAFLTPFATTRLTALTVEDEIFLALIRLRLAFFLDDLANRFASTVSRIFQKWLDIMYFKLCFLITWPKREVIRQNLPPAFKSLYPNCCCIIDCSEIFIEMPTSFSVPFQLQKAQYFKSPDCHVEVFRFSLSVGAVECQISN